MAEFPPTLLGLPPELRTMIYTYALKSDQHITIDAQLQQPSLLLTCHLIRSEASPIHVNENRFEITIRKCDSSLFRRFGKLRRRLGGTPGFECIKVWQEVPNWTNLVSWSHAIWAGPCLRLFEEHDADEADDLQNSLAVVFAAHDAAFEAKRERRSWKDVERELRRIRELAGRLDAKWLED